MLSFQDLSLGISGKLLHLLLYWRKKPSVELRRTLIQQALVGKTRCCTTGCQKIIQSHFDHLLLVIVVSLFWEGEVGHPVVVGEKIQGGNSSLHCKGCSLNERLQTDAVFVSGENFSLRSTWSKSITSKVPFVCFECISQPAWGLSEGGMTRVTAGGGKKASY